MEALWPIITIVGPILLVVVLVWAVLRNRRVTPAQDARTERATRELYAEEDRRSAD